MLDEKQQKLELSPADYIRQRATPENGLSELIASFEGQEEILEQIESDNVPFFESLNKLKEFDPDVYFGVIDSIINLVETKKIQAADIPKLVFNFETSDEAPEETLKRYGSEKGAMSWRGYVITIYSNLKQRDSEGNLIYNISHHLNHEIGHSIFEIEAISPEEINQLFDGVGTEFESNHIKKLEANSADPELLLKERFAELMGIFLRAESQAQFYDFRSRNCPAEVQRAIASDQSTKERFEEETAKLYQRINQIWPTIQQKLGTVDLEEHLTSNEFSDESAYGEFDEQTQVVNEESAEGNLTDSAQPQESDSGADKKEAKKQPATYDETAELARKNKVDESIGMALKRFAQSFGELDILSGNQ